MNKEQSNLRYFELSRSNPEPHLDVNYFILEKHPDLNLYISKVREIKHLLITVNQLKKEKESMVVIEQYYQKLFDIFNSDYANCSELGCFVNACDTTRDLIQKDFESFKVITNLFISKRMLDDKAPENWIQAILDSNSSRRKGELGEKKLLAILGGYGYKEVENWKDFLNSRKSVARFSKEMFSTPNVRKNLNIRMKTKKQDKRMDLLIKDNSEFYLCEAKHLNTGGGEQDKQLSELIEIISLAESQGNIHYVAFLDGTYSNALLGEVSSRAKKKLKQLKEIKKYLHKNPNNFWLNTHGFQKLFNDLNK